MNSGATFDGLKHTYDDFNMIPKSIITFAPPLPKLEIQELKGASGELDYSKEITGKLRYNNRKGTLEFLVLTGTDYQDAYNAACAFFDGRERVCVLDDDPGMQYVGRFWVNDWKSWEGASKIAIDYDIQPHRYSKDDIYLRDWLWDEVKLQDDEEILYAWQFEVDGQKWRNLYNPSSVEVTPTITCSARMRVDYDNVSFILKAGINSRPGFNLQPGDNIMKFYGTGTVSLQYPLEVE